MAQPAGFNVKMIIELVLLIMAIPAGFVVSYLTREELVDGRKWFMALIIFSGVSGVVLVGYGFFSEALASFFISIFSVVSYWKSSDRKWTKRR